MVDVGEIDRISAVADPVMRNLRITECYHRLAVALAASGVEGANWCAYATWASRQAGGTIRGEDLFDRLAARSRGGSWRHPVRALWRWLLRRGLFRPQTRLGRVVREIHTPFDAFERASEAVARGNLKVFAEIGREFARYLAALSRGDDLAAFLQPLQPGPAPDGQDGLRRAFTLYHEQRRETSPAIRRAKVLLANLEIGRHEQTRLQPEIVAALESATTTAYDLGARVLAILSPPLARQGAWVRRPLGAFVAAVAIRYRRHAENFAREVVTESLMVLTMPEDLVLRLGDQLPLPVPSEFRASEDADLRSFWDDCARGRIPGECGADDWGDLGQRMYYIQNLFAACHDRRELFASPYAARQTAEIRAGVVPDGRL
jgi:hypothetical protein